MKYVDKLIQEYKYAIYNDTEFTFTGSRYFEWDTLYDELFDVSEVQDKIIFLKFIEYQMSKEFYSLEYHIESSKKYLKKHSPNDDKYAFSLYNNLEYNDEKYKMLKSYLVTIESEIRDLHNLLKDEKKEVINSNNIKDNINLEEPLSKNSKKDLKTRKIQWLEDETVIVYLYEMLYAKGCISKSDYDYFPEFVVKNFLNKNGKPFILKNLNSSKSNLKDNVKKFEPRNAHKVKQIFENKNKF